MIERDEAKAIAAREIAAHGSGSGVRHVLLLHELSFRAPKLYGGPDLASCWIAYAERTIPRIEPSIIVLIDKSSGAVLYHGSANDEG